MTCLLSHQELELEWLERHCLRVLPGATDFANSTSSLFGALKETFDFQVSRELNTRKWGAQLIQAFQVSFSGNFSMNQGRTVLLISCVLCLEIQNHSGVTSHHRPTACGTSLSTSCRCGARVAPWWLTALLGSVPLWTRTCCCRRRFWSFGIEIWRFF